jgi:predicted lipoprotein with Yx(FWY)xxD motif
MRRAMTMAAVAMAAIMMLAACGDDDDAATTGTASASTTTAAPASETATTAAPASGTATTEPAAPASVAVGSTSLGDVLVDGNGRTLYVFTADAADTSNCTGGCLQAWPRYAPATVNPGAGVDKSLLGTITVDGVKQATINHRPLYYFASDSAAGDVQGQGVGGKWFVVAADGTPVEG